MSRREKKFTKREKKFLFLDEAVSHLDMKHQRQLLQVAKQLCNLQSTVIVILHDINLAITYADRILFMKDGRIAYEIAQDEEVTPEIIKDVFDVKVKIIQPGNGHKPIVVF